MAINDVFLRPDAGDGPNGVRLRPDGPDSPGTKPFFNAPLALLSAVSVLALGAVFTPPNIAINTPADTSVQRGAVFVNQRELPPKVAVDTSQGMPATLRSGVVTAPFSIAPQPAVPDARRPLLDTSRGTPTAYLPAPFRPMPTALDIRRLWQPADTSAGSAAYFPAVVEKPYTQAQIFNPVEPRRDVVDTSKGTAKTLYDDVVPPRQQALDFAPDRLRPVWDTSRGFLPPAVAAPVVPNQTAWSLRTPWQVADTSTSTPAIFYGPAPVPVFNAPYTAPDRVRAVTDTSQGTPYALFGPPPVKPPQQIVAFAALRPLFIFSDTTLGTPLPLLDSAPPPPPPPPPDDKNTPGRIDFADIARNRRRQIEERDLAEARGRTEEQKAVVDAVAQTATDTNLDQVQRQGLLRAELERIGAIADSIYLAELERQYARLLEVRRQDEEAVAMMLIALLSE